LATEPATAIASDDLSGRVMGAYSRSRGLDAGARRAFLAAIQDLTLCFVSAWNRMRERGATSETLFADLGEARFRIAELGDQAEILAACRAEMEPRERNHYTPSLRFRIVEHMRKYMLSIDEAADRFVVTGQTIGTGSPSSIETREPPLPEPPPPPETKLRETTVRGRYPNHLVLMDATRIPVLFPFLFLHVMGVLDAFSRLPLASMVRLFEPSASDAVALLKNAIRVQGRPRHLVTDQGAQFTAGAFREFVKSQDIRQRYGRVGECHSLGLVDRFFRTLKESLGVGRERPWSFRGLPDFRRRLELALVHYSCVRPHAALQGTTPVECFHGIRGHLPTPARPPRGRRGEPASDPPFEIIHLDPDNNAFPVLVPKAA
jgi:transposase InsO family protein